MNYNTRKGNQNNTRRVHSDTNRAVMLMVWLLVLIIVGVIAAHNMESSTPTSKPSSSDTTPIFEDGPDMPDTYVPAIPETVEVTVPPTTETAPESTTEPIEVTLTEPEKVVAVDFGSDSTPIKEPHTIPTTPVDEEQIYLPYCEQEDSTTCYWDATRRGNGIGRSFVNISGTTYYLP